MLSSGIMEAPSSKKPVQKRSAIDILLSVLGILAALSLAFTAWFYRDTILRPAAAPLPSLTSTPTLISTLAPTATPFADLPPYDDLQTPEAGILRTAMLHTTLPDFSIYQLREYEVQKNDTLYGIAEKFKIKPQTILWGNEDILFDNPDLLSVGTKLRILPADGVLYRWSKDDGLNGVAKYFKVSPEEIVEWPGNNLNEETIGDFSKPNIAEGTRLFIPGGKREFRATNQPVVSRRNPGTSRVPGEGSCGTIDAGTTGSGAFVWPSSSHDISGYGYDPSINHPGIDIGGQLGNPVYSTDGGVVVYAGWSEWGYGNLIIVDHGNGWQSLYAHLSAILVGCGQSVSQGAQIGTVGSTGRSTGPHLHFELSINGAKVNPLGYVQ